MKKQVKFLFPFEKQGYVNNLYSNATVLDVEYKEDGVFVEAVVDAKIYGMYKDFLIK